MCVEQQRRRIEEAVGPDRSVEVEADQHVDLVFWLLSKARAVGDHLDDFDRAAFEWLNYGPLRSSGLTHEETIAELDRRYSGQ